MNNLTITGLIRSSGLRFRYRLPLLCFCLLACAVRIVHAQGSPQPGAAEARTTTSNGGSIGGNVTGEDGQPLAFATVYVSKAFASGMGQQQTISTDGEGKFQAANLAPGLYSISAFAPGLVSRPETSSGSGEGRYYRVGDTVNLTLMKGGVITGTVRDANGEPLVAVPVRALFVRNASGRAITLNSAYSQFRLTDDRGIYRIYGLMPGTYLVSAGGASRLYIGASSYEDDIPTYYPSSTRDTAAEIPMHSGEEVNNVDIRYRGERGHIISGTIANNASEPGATFAIQLTLRQTSSGAIEASTSASPYAKLAFSFTGVADGVYDLEAYQGSSSGNGAISAPRRITVKGADVTGIELTLAPLSSITGRAVLEPVQKKEGCGGSARPATLIETLINARRAEKSTAEASSMPLYTGSSSAVAGQGEFTIRNLGAGGYRLAAWLPSDFWYLRSVVLPGTTTRPAASTSKTAETKSATTSSLINLKAGENFTGINVNIAQDGAVVTGRVTADVKEGAQTSATIPENLRIYLVPTERERAEDLLRYAEVKPDSDGVFSFKHLAPGRYWLIARPFVEDESPNHLVRPLAWDADARAKLRHAAEAQNTAVELSPCKNISDQMLRYPLAK